MSALHALLGFTAWTLLLVAAVLTYRGLRLLKGSPINAWPRGAHNTGDATLMKRVGDAHANCLENLLPFAAIVLSAHALGKFDTIAALATPVGTSAIAVVRASGPQVPVLVTGIFGEIPLPRDRDLDILGA